MPFGVIDKGPGLVTVLPPGNRTLCDEAIQYAFYSNGDKESGECFDDEEAAKQGCPDGWEFVKTTQAGCAIGAIKQIFTSPTVRPICRKTEFAKESDIDKLDCCLRQDASQDTGSDCPPGFCKAKINAKGADSRDLDEGCYDVFERHCLGKTVRFDGQVFYDATNMFFDADCKSYVLSEQVRDGPHKREIGDTMKRLCDSAGRFAATSSLCKCVTTTNPDLCSTGDCFARMNEQLANLATCIAPECSLSGTYIPPAPEGGCPDSVCAPLLTLKCVDLQSQEAINVLLLCEAQGKISKEKADELRRQYNISDKDLEKAREKREQGTVHVVPEQRPEPTPGSGVDIAAGTNATDNNNNKNKNNKPGQLNSNNNNNDAGKGVPTWALWTIGAVALLLVLALVLGVVFAIRNRQRKKQRQEESESFGLSQYQPLPSTDSDVYPPFSVESEQPIAYGGDDLF